jgi:uncharacterized membrane protein YcaP (DUF421 family)
MMMEEFYWVMLRGLIIYLGGLVLIRISGKRFLSKESPFDVILAFILGSTLSRGINGSASVAVSLFAVIILVLLHAFISLLTFYFPKISKIVKGDAAVLVRDGIVQQKAMQQYYLTEGDLLEALRLKGHLDRPDQAKVVNFERSGSFSIIPKKKSPKVIEVAVEEGVKTVRVEFE